MFSACNETKWHHQWERLSHWPTHLGLKTHKFLENNQGFGSLDAQCAHETLGFAGAQRAQASQDKTGTQGTRVSREKLGWDSRCTNFRTCFCCATALVDFQVPALCKCETMRDLPLEGSTKLFQDNAMEPQGFALRQVATGDKST